MEYIIRQEIYIPTIRESIEEIRNYIDSLVNYKRRDKNHNKNPANKKGKEKTPKQRQPELINSGKRKRNPN